MYICIFHETLIGESAEASAQAPHERCRASSGLAKDSGIVMIVITDSIAINVIIVVIVAIVIVSIIAIMSSKQKGP